jgi:hypothetical protein
MLPGVLFLNFCGSRGSLIVWKSLTVPASLSWKAFEFKEYWNNHCPCCQNEKTLPTAEYPIKIFNFPENYDLVHSGIKVEIEVVQHLWQTLGKSREGCFRWVPDEFDITAQGVYKQIGSPEFKITSGWFIFCGMLPHLK